MFEKHCEPLAKKSVFYLRLLNSILFGVIFILLALFLGIMGLRYFENLSWIDAFSSAAMILSGVGATTSFATAGGKVFAGVYALFSGFAFLTIVGVIFAPIFHRFLHRFYMKP